MKNFLSLSALSLIALTFSCSDDLKDPGYPDTPSIKFKNIRFKEVEGISEADTLKLTITYKDGDSDLGLSSLDEADFLAPYNSEYFFIENGTNDTTRIAPTLYSDYKVIRTPPGSGLLVTADTRNKAGYNYLPAYLPYSCENYIYTQVLVSEHSVDESFDILDTITINGENFIKIEGPLLTSQNGNHTNIAVKFYVFKNGAFEEFDWFKEYCITYNGRFPLIDKRYGIIRSSPFKVRIKSRWEGELTYNMANTSWLALFGDAPMKLEITIKDRALNTSNTIITREFVLNEIK